MLRLPDGPVSQCHCTACGTYCHTDIYRYLGVILCGDCRYFVRHGRLPNYDANPGGNTRAADEVIEIQDAIYHGYVV